MKTILTNLFCTILLGLTACGARPATPAPAPTSTLVATRVAATPTTLPRVSLLDQELLGLPLTQAACDAPPEATFDCENEATAPRLNVDISAATFARWSFHWEGAIPLSGDETIALRLTSSGNLTPNFYLVTADGQRLGMPLGQFGLEEGAQTIHIPLREVRDAAGRDISSVSDYAQINGIEIVFEWADMQGTLALESLRVDSVWTEALTLSEDAEALAAALEVPTGFNATALVEDLRELTQIDFTPTGDMLVSLQNGRIWWHSDLDGDGLYDQRHLYATGFNEVVGMLYDPVDGGVWLGGRGQLVHTLDSDGNGVADQRSVRLEGLPWGRHQNNGLAWNPDPDPFSGEPGSTWLYFGLGSTDDLEVGGELNATILRFPRTGQSTTDLEIVSRGNRNAYNVRWALLPVTWSEPDGPRAWQLFASENGPDFNDAPDEVNHIRWGYHYGFPDQFGPVSEPEVEGDPYSGPVYPVTAHASANGLAYINHPDWPVEYRTLYVALFGEVFNPTPVGHIVERISLHTETTPSGEVTYRGDPSPFVVGLDRPLPLVTAPDGNMLVGDYATGFIYKITYTGTGD
jgi:glucose/arabinose dehydrogenase